MLACPRCASALTRADLVCAGCGFRPVVSSGIPLFAPALAESDLGFERSAFVRLARLEAANFWFRNRNRLILRMLHRYCPQMKQFLEFGCGTGFVLNAVAGAFPDCIITGTDLHPEGLAIARERLGSRATLLQSDAVNLPFREEFDVIGAFDVLEHIEDDRRALTVLRDALRPGGTVLITVPQHKMLWSRYDVIGHHYRRYERNELHDKVSTAGFDILYSTSFVSLLLPLMFLSRWMHRGEDRHSDDQFSELELGRIANGMLAAVLLGERLMLRAGLRFPVGGSRLLVARKS